MERRNENNVIQSNKPEFKFSPIPVPRDPDDARYVISFALAQVSEIKEFWDQYGIVVIRDIITPKECTDTINEVYQILEAGTNRKFKREDKSTWSNWPSDGIEKYGQPSRPPLFTPCILNNRQNPNLHSAFTTVLGTPNLLVSHDRACLFRPTKNVSFPDGSVQDMPRWKTGYGVHLDINPYHWMADDMSGCIEKWKRLNYGDQLNHFITENNIGHKSAMHVQGVLNLEDNYEEDGGFICVPGFVHQFDTWYEANKKQLSNIITSPSVSFSKDHWLNRHAIRISMRPGSLVIWDSRTPHGSASNNSSRMRCCQFIKMFIATDILSSKALRLRSETVKTQIRISKFQEPVLTPLGKQVFGLVQEFNHGISFVPRHTDNQTNNTTTTTTTTTTTNTNTDTDTDNDQAPREGGQRNGKGRGNGSQTNDRGRGKKRLQGNKW